MATPENKESVRKAAVAAGVELVSLAVFQTWSSPDEEKRLQAVARWKDVIQLAVDLECPRINTELSGDPNLPTECRQAFLRSIGELLPIIDAEGLTVAVEPHPWDFLETTDQALDLIDEVGSTSLRYLHCIPHSFHLGGSITEQIMRTSGKLDHIHLADSFKPGRTIVNPPGLDCRIHQHFDIGSGEIDWNEVTQALNAVNFDGIATVQVFFWEDRAEESIRVNRLAVDRILGIT